MNNNSFLKEKLIFTDTSLFFYDKNNKVRIVMDDCENSLMKKTAEKLVNEGDDLLEIGFGMGIFANYAQLKNPKSHTIVEGHPQVYERLLLWAQDKPNVVPIFGSWLSTIDKVKTKKYDSVYFDTHLDQDAFLFFNSIKNSIKINGRFSRFGLESKMSALVEKEFGTTDIKIYYEEYHKVIPSEFVDYINNQSFPICIVSL